VTQYIKSKNVRIFLAIKVLQLLKTSVLSTNANL